jgi:hypothetical protein
MIVQYLKRLMLLKKNRVLRGLCPSLEKSFNTGRGFKGIRIKVSIRR